MIRGMVTGNEKPIPEHATLHLIPWVTHKVYGAVGLSDTVCVTANGGESLLPAHTPGEKIALIAPRSPHLNDALRVRYTFGILLTPTPLVVIAPRQLGPTVDFTILVKDESTRLGQTAFKALGGGYACARELMRRKGVAVGTEGAVFDKLARRVDKNSSISGSGSGAEEEIVFTSATDGNHGTLF
jgi:hypothetical protein